MTGAEQSALKALYAPTAAELASQVTDARMAMDIAMSLLEERPTVVNVNLVKIQLLRTGALVDQLRATLIQEGGE